MNEETLLWYDLESFGLETDKTRIAQFAAIRTDLDFNLVAEPINIMCCLAPDYLPTPESCLVTGQTPQQVNTEGLVEAEFISIIHKEFMQKNTTVVGFNNLNYDDELIRHTLYRNLYSPYEREFGDGRTKWDILPLARAVHDLRPEGINFFHKTPKGNPQLKLTTLTEDNKIEQVGAHDALVDVYATINFAKLVKTKQPALYNYFFKNRTKAAIKKTLSELKNNKILLHTDQSHTNNYGFTRPIFLLTTINEKTNNVYYFDLTQDANDLLKDFNTSNEVKGLGILKLNKCPCLTAISMLEKEVELQNRLNIDMAKYRKNVEILMNHPELEDIILSKEKPYEAEEKDIDFNLYSAGFPSYEITNEYKRIQKADKKDKIKMASASTKEKVFRYVARSYPEALTEDEMVKWRSFVKDRIGNINEYYEKINATYNNLARFDITLEKGKLILEKLVEYAKELEKEYL